MCFSNSVKAVVLYFCSPFCLQAVSLQGLFKIRGGGITKPAKISNGALSTLDTSFSAFFKKHLIFLVTFLFLPTLSDGFKNIDAQVITQEGSCLPDGSVFVYMWVDES